MNFIKIEKNGNLESEYTFPHIIHSIQFDGDTIYGVGDHSHFYQINYKVLIIFFGNIS